VDELYKNFEKMGIRQEHKEHCSAYFAAYNSVTKSVNKRLEYRFFQTGEPTKCNRGLQSWLVGQGKVQTQLYYSFVKSQKIQLFDQNCRD